MLVGETRTRIVEARYPLCSVYDCNVPHRCQRQEDVRAWNRIADLPVVHLVGWYRQGSTNILKTIDAQRSFAKELQTSQSLPDHVGNDINAS